MSVQRENYNLFWIWINTIWVGAVSVHPDTGFCGYAHENQRLVHEYGRFDGQIMSHGISSLCSDIPGPCGISHLTVSFPSSLPGGPLRVRKAKDKSLYLHIQGSLRTSSHEPCIYKNRMTCVIRPSLLAVRAGFEPAVRLPVRQFSKLVVSATHPSHLRPVAKSGLQIYKEI